MIFFTIIDKCLIKIYNLCITIEKENLSDLSINSLSNYKKEKYGARGIFSFCDESGRICLTKLINEVFIRCCFFSQNSFTILNKHKINFENNFNLNIPEIIDKNPINNERNIHRNCQIENRTSCVLKIFHTISNVIEKIIKQSNLYASKNKQKKKDKKKCTNDRCTLNENKKENISSSINLSSINKHNPVQIISSTKY